MKATLNKKTSEFDVTITAKKDVWKKAQTSTEEKLIKNLAIKGFRKGNVPPAIAKKHIAQAEIFQKAIESVLNDLGKEASKEIKEDMLILDSPIYKIEKISNAELEIKFSYPVYPEFKIADYKNLDVKFEEVKIEDKRIEEELKKIAASQTMLKDKEGAIKKGDVTIFDFEGFVDGKPFDGGKAEKHQLEIGSGQFIPGFEDQMVGLKKGDAKDVIVTFPKEYHVEDLKNKEATFKIKIHEVKTKEEPKMDDEFAKSVGAPNVKNMVSLRKYMKEVFAEQERQAARSRFQREAFDIIKKNTKDLVVPPSLIMKETQNLVKSMQEQMAKQGVTFEQYKEMTGMDDAKLNAQQEEQAKQRLFDSLIFAEISKLEKIEIKDNEYDKEYEKLAKVYGQTVDGIKATITKQQMQLPMTNDKVIDVLIKNLK